MRQTRISPEARFVTLATRERGPGTSGRIQRAARQVRDWPEVVRLAAEHRVGAYVRNAITLSGIVLPESIEAALYYTVRVSLAQVMILTGGLRKVNGALAAAGVSPMILKGPALAHMIYPAPIFRPYGDIDLNVLDRDESRAIDVLIGLGYVEIPDVAEEAYRQHAVHGHNHGEYHRQYASPDGSTLVELHTDPLQLGLRPNCETDRWDRALGVPGLPNAVMLCPEDQLVQLSVHVHKHGFDRLIWLKDIDLLLRTYGDALNWDIVVDVAGREGVRASVWYTLRLTSRLLATPLPNPAVSRFRPALPIRVLYRLVWPPLKIENLGGEMHRRAVQVRGADSWRGVLPSLVLMGRRRDRARAALRLLGRR
jgi:hypothetical protein